MNVPGRVAQFRLDYDGTRQAMLVWVSRYSFDVMPSDDYTQRVIDGCLCMYCDELPEYHGPNQQCFFAPTYYTRRSSGSP